MNPALQGDADGDEVALRRLRMRAWRRGTREMDLILGPFADEVLPELDAPARAAFEALLDENDHDLYRWISARLAAGGSAGTEADRADAPERFIPLMARIAAHASTRLGGG